MSPARFHWITLATAALAAMGAALALTLDAGGGRTVAPLHEAAAAAAAVALSPPTT